MRDITLNSIVKYQSGYYRVSRLTKKTVNLKSIFGKTIYHKSIPISEVNESSNEWYEKWSKSESYRCM